MASKMVEVMKWLGDGCIFKIDFEKVYDCVYWYFLDSILG